jgi:NADPH-dependent curcumin reductase CurA
VEADCTLTRHSYAPAFDLDKPLTSRSICKVLKSANENFKEGQTIATMCNMSDYTVVPKEMLAQATVIANPHNIDIAHSLGALGMPG